MYDKLKEFSKSFLWLLGASILIAQVYRIVAFYLFNVPMEMELGRDLPLTIFAIVLMFLQNNLKTAARTALKKIPNLLTGKNGNKDNE